MVIEYTNYIKVSDNIIGEEAPRLVAVSYRNFVRIFKIKMPRPLRELKPDLPCQGPVQQSPLQPKPQTLSRSLYSRHPAGQAEV